jgi:hypothetical protein
MCPYGGGAFILIISPRENFYRSNAKYVLLSDA